MVPSDISSVLARQHIDVLCHQAERRRLAHSRRRPKGLLVGTDVQRVGGASDGGSPRLPTTATGRAGSTPATAANALLASEPAVGR